MADAHDTLVHVPSSRQELVDTFPRPADDCASPLYEDRPLEELGMRLEHLDDGLDVPDIVVRIETQLADSPHKTPPTARAAR